MEQSGEQIEAKQAEGRTRKARKPLEFTAKRIGSGTLSNQDALAIAQIIARQVLAGLQMSEDFA